MMLTIWEVEVLERYPKDGGTFRLEITRPIGEQRKKSFKNCLFSYGFIGALKMNQRLVVLTP